MATFISSRLSAGNKILPDKIIIDQNGVTFRVPGFFSGEEKTVPFSRISSVDLNTPFVGYSSITINTTGEGAIAAHGFYKKDVLEMKRLILEKIHAE
jgi:hypothetical protein